VVRSGQVVEEPWGLRTGRVGRRRVLPSKTITTQADSYRYCLNNELVIVRIEGTGRATRR